MEAQPTSDPSSAAAYPRWVMLQKNLKIQAVGSTCSTPGAGEMLAAARTSTGHLIEVSLRPVEPTGVSCVCLHIPDGLDAKYSLVVAAHGDSVLIEVSTEEKNGNTEDHLLYPCKKTRDHFVYNAGAAAADLCLCRPPSLSLLPSVDLDSNGTGLMRRGEDELVLAQLTAVPATPDTPELTRVADLSLFCHGEWSIKSLQIMFLDDSDTWIWDFPSWSWNAVIPVGDGLLCWVDLERRVVVLCDVFEETPRLQFRRLPVENIQGPRSNRNVCSTAAGDALKFINVFPHCCCGEASATFCKCSLHAYTIHTWTMMIAGTGASAMEWVMDGVDDATELWAFDAYKGLPCLPLDHPVLSMEDPDLICFGCTSPRLITAIGTIRTGR